MKRIRRILRPQEGPHTAVSPVMCTGILLILAAVLLTVWPSAPAAAQVAVRKTGPAQASKANHDGYARWLDEDVSYIATDAERAEFQALSNNSDRDQFIERFWQHRDKDEHYRRIAYANDHFTASVPGWQTQRGQTYIKHGPPSTIENRGDLEVWKYQNAAGLGGAAQFVFGDPGHTGDYQLKTVDVHKASALHENSLHKTLYDWHMNAFRFFHNLFHW